MTDCCVWAERSNSNPSGYQVIRGDGETAGRVLWRRTLWHRGGIALRPQFCVVVSRRDGERRRVQTTAAKSMPRRRITPAESDEDEDTARGECRVKKELLRFPRRKRGQLFNMGDG